MAASFDDASPMITRFRQEQCEEILLVYPATTQANTKKQIK
jgi:hypothetical protein